ncbi:MAG: WYL domain-containing protein [Sphingopyxis sp.]|nr:WYL domain-containing protein [Sphingopyxis sp.]
MMEPEESQKVNATHLRLRERLEFIEFQLYWTGRLNRIDLMDQFRISPPQASADIAQYQELAPGNLDYDTVRKGYVRSQDFTPDLIGRAIDRYMMQIVGIERGWLRPSDTWLTSLPPVEVVSLERVSNDPEVVMAVLDAIRDASEIEIDYCSMTGSPATPRSIAPHAMGFAWGRWYVRSWSRDHNDFRDYAMARIVKVHAAKPRTIDPAGDLEWHHKIDLILVPNPELEDDRRRAQEIEHRMEDGKLAISCRLSMAFYLMAEHKLAVTPGKLTPLEQPLVLSNLDEVVQAREVARKLATQALQRASS